MEYIDRGSSDEILVKEYRGSVLEDIHRGHICVINGQKKVIHHVGDPLHYTYMRSIAKPIMLLPFLDLGLDKKFGLTEEEITVMGASQMAAPYHLKALESISSKMDIAENMLALNPCFPFHEGNMQEVLRQGKPKRKFYHVCAGKHLASIALARELGDDPRNYYKMDSAVQQLMWDYIAQFSEYSREEISVGLDGCGIPVFAMPLRNIAIAYYNMVYPSERISLTTADNARRVVKLYHRHHDYVTNVGFLCTELNADPAIFGKGGAQAVYCFVLKEQKIAVSFKVSDGSEVEWNLIIAEILEQFGHANQETIAKIRALRPPEMISATGEVAGRYETTFRLTALTG